MGMERRMRLPSAERCGAAEGSHGHRHSGHYGKGSPRGATPEPLPRGRAPGAARGSRGRSGLRPAGLPGRSSGSSLPLRQSGAGQAAGISLYRSFPFPVRGPQGPSREGPRSPWEMFQTWTSPQGRFRASGTAHSPEKRSKTATSPQPLSRPPGTKRSCTVVLVSRPLLESPTHSLCLPPTGIAAVRVQEGAPQPLRTALIPAPPRVENQLLGSDSSFSSQAALKDPIDLMANCHLPARV